MASPVEKEGSESVGALDASLDDEFYVATFRGGRVRRVINKRVGPTLRVRGLAEFRSKVELEKEEALSLKRKQWGSWLGNEVQVGKGERTLGEVLQEMKRRKSAGSLLATVQWNPPPVNEVVPAEISSLSKKRKRRKSASELYPCSKVAPPSEHSIAQRDDETLADWLKRSAGTTGRASSDNSGIKVFQRRKIKFKAIRDRVPEKETPAVVSSKSRAKRSISKSENSDCEPNIAQDITVRSSELETSQSTSMVSDHHPENLCASSFSLQNYEELDDHLPYPDSSMDELDTPILPDTPQLSVRLDDPCTQEPASLETENVEGLTQFPDKIAPSNTSVSPESLRPRNSLVKRDLRFADASNVNPELPESGMQVMKLDDELTSAEGDVGLGTFVFSTETSTPWCPESLNENSHSDTLNSASVVTPVELELAEESIDAILDTLVTPDDLMPNHLLASVNGASKTTKKKRKRKRKSLRETGALDMLITNKDESCCMGTLLVDNLSFSQKRKDDLTGEMCLDRQESLTENVHCSAMNIMEEVAFSDTRESSDTFGPQASNEAQLGLQEERHGLAHGSAAFGLYSVGEGTPTVLPSILSETLLNAEEGCISESQSPMAVTGADDVPGTPTKSTTTPSTEDKGICQTNCTSLDGGEGNIQDAFAGGILTSEVDLFSNLKTDDHEGRSHSPFPEGPLKVPSKRNRKTFSPKSRLALLESITPFKIKLMKSNLSDQCPSKMASQKMDIRRAVSCEDRNTVADDSFADKKAQEKLDCDMEQVQQVAASSESHPLSLPTQATQNDSPDMSEPSPSGAPSDSNSTHIVVPGSPEHNKEPSVSHKSSKQHVSICAAEGGSLVINVDCLPGSPTCPNTPEDTLKPSGQPKSILKTDDTQVTCQGICKCPRCVSACDQAETARGFINSQMKLADGIARRLIIEMQNMRALVEDQQCRAQGEASTSCDDSSSDKARGALESAAKTEDWAIKQLLKLSRDSKRVCRLIETRPRRTIFADDAGRQLCHVKYLPKKLPRVSSA